MRDESLGSWESMPLDLQEEEDTYQEDIKEAMREYKLQGNGFMYRKLKQEYERVRWSPVYDFQQEQKELRRRRRERKRRRAERKKRKQESGKVARLRAKLEKLKQES